MNKKIELMYLLLNKAIDFNITENESTKSLFYLLDLKTVLIDLEFDIKHPDKIDDYDELIERLRKISGLVFDNDKELPY